MKYENEEMERSVLASMLISPEYIPNIVAEISETDFYYNKYREIYRSILAMHDKDAEINILTLSNHLKNKYVIDVATLTDIIPTGKNWQYYCDKVRKFSQLRRFREILEEASKVNESNITEKLNSFSADAARISEATGGGKIKTARDFVMPMIDKISKAIDRQTEYSGYDTGLNSINTITDGLQKEYIIIGARASIGKTALAINITRSLVRKNIKVGFFSLEMSGTSLLMRMLSDLSKNQASIIKNGLVNKKTAERINNIGCEMMEWPLYLLDDTRGDFDKIVAKIRYMVRCLGVQVIMIDHASLMKYKDRKIQRYEQFSEMSNILQNLQRELDVPIVVMAQLGREAEGRKPSIADLRESGAFEQDADQVWIMHRERAKDSNETNIPTDVYIAKNRNGACGTAKLFFQPQFIRFVDKAPGFYDKIADEK